MIKHSPKTLASGEKPPPVHVIEGGCLCVSTYSTHQCICVDVEKFFCIYVYKVETSERWDGAQMGFPEGTNAILN